MIKIFRDGLRNQLDDGERVEADVGYIGDCPYYCKCPKSIVHKEGQQQMRGELRMRHENVNKRFKNFECLANRFRHPLNKHSPFFRAVAVLTQLSISGGEALFGMREYHDNLTDAQVQVLYGL